MVRRHTRILSGSAAIASLVLLAPGGAAARSTGLVLELRPLPASGSALEQDASSQTTGPWRGEPLSVRLGDRVIGQFWRPATGRIIGRPVSLDRTVHEPLVTLGVPRQQVDGNLPPGFPPPLAFPRRLYVVTTLSLISRSTLLEHYLAWKEASGWQVVLGLERDWDWPVAEDGDDRQARIRAWLKRAVEAGGPGFLLLVGDPTPETGDVPMRRTDPIYRLLTFVPWDEMQSLSGVPTDSYYADLESSWDCSGNGFFGEYPDDLARPSSGQGGGSGNGSGEEDLPPVPCADWGPELVVGRIPVYGGNSTVLDRILQRILDWELAQDKSWRSRVLLAGAFGGFRGLPASTVTGHLAVDDEDDDFASFLHRIGEDLASAYEVPSFRLFEDEGVIASAYPHDGSLSMDAFIQAWSQGYGAVSWGGHGSANGVYRLVWWRDDNLNEWADSWEEVATLAMLESWETRRLAQAPSAFVHAMSCEVGHPEDPGNLGTSLLLAGAVGTATASRSTTDINAADWEPMPELGGAQTHAYYFNMLLQGGATAGEALAYTRYALPANGWGELSDGADVYNSLGWLIKLQYNLYGDPTLGLERCDAAAGCDDGLPCNGVESCEHGFCVRRDVPDCRPLDGPCTLGVCDNATGQCQARPRTDGVACDDGIWCTTQDRCLAGACHGGEPRPCPAAPGFVPVCDESARRCDLEPAPPEEDAGTHDAADGGAEADAGVADAGEGDGGATVADSGSAPGPQEREQGDDGGGGCRMAGGGAGGAGGGRGGAGWLLAAGCGLLAAAARGNRAGQRQH